MKKLLVSLGLLLVPLVAGAAYNDVSLGTSAIISINNPLGNAVSLTVTGSADVVESIVVNAASFDVTLQSGSTLTVASAGRNLISSTAPSTNASTACSDSQSSLTLTATAEVTANVTVSANACGSSTTSTATGSNGPVAQSGGGGGGGGSYIAPQVQTVTPSTTSAATVEQLQAMIASLMAQIQALGGNTGSTGAGTSSGFMSNTKLKVGSKGNDVLDLQKFLNSDPDTQVAVSGAGSPGNETTYFGLATRKAIQKFQVKYGIAGPGKTGYGNFGPATRAKMIELSK